MWFRSLATLFFTVLGIVACAFAFVYKIIVYGIPHDEVVLMFDCMRDAKAVDLAYTGLAAFGIGISLWVMAVYSVIRMVKVWMCQAFMWASQKVVVATVFIGQGKENYMAEIQAEAAEMRGRRQAADAAE